MGWAERYSLKPIQTIGTVQRRASSLAHPLSSHPNLPPLKTPPPPIPAIPSFTAIHSIPMDPTAPPSSPPHQLEECRGVLRVFSDGSIVRSPKPSFDVPIRDDGSVVWKDSTFHPAHRLQLRLYKPSSSSAAAPAKYPVFYYFHGGGYCIGSRTWPNCHNYCLRVAAELPAVVVAPDYRLAPECRLPAAVEDAVAAVEWLRKQALAADPDPWLAEAADFGRVFISGDSAGGNLSHHLAIRLGAGSPDLAPVRIRGYVHLAPFFGGTVRTKSEAESPKDAFFPLELNDR
ncbi:hypothetical protein ACLOJK_005677 [Asimina triloba]